MKTMLRTVTEKKKDGTKITYEALMFKCPGCALFEIGSGLHMLPVNSHVKKPSWEWNGHLELPTLRPSILTDKDGPHRCHSFLVDGVFQFLKDCAHPLAGQYVDIPDLPDWVERMDKDVDRDGDKL